MWAGRFEKATDKVADDFNSSIRFDCKLYKEIIIENAIKKKASDIHFEPMESYLRVRYRIDGELYEVAEIPKEKQAQVIGRLKAISNMYQEKQEDQDGRIILYPEYNIRVSSQKNIYGEKFVLRLLKKIQVKKVFLMALKKSRSSLNGTVKIHLQVNMKKMIN